jgi:hypothetical protein
MPARKRTLRAMAGRTQGFRIGAVRAGWLWQRICGALCRQPAGNATFSGPQKTPATSDCRAKRKCCLKQGLLVPHAAAHFLSLFQRQLALAHKQILLFPN